MTATLCNSSTFRCFQWFFLMFYKTEEAYRTVLQYTRETLITWPIISIITDFERSLVNAVRQVFIGAEHHGCWFHFCQVSVQNSFKIT